MKRYYNPNTKEWYTECQTITRKVDNGVFSGIPSVEQLTAWGFEEWVEPAPTPEQELATAKVNKIAELDAYNNSNEINEFIVNIGDNQMTAWITPEIRSNYRNSIDSAKLLGVETLHPVINGIELEITVSVAEIALAKVQLYADRCFAVTEKHRATINALSDIDDVNNYNFKEGYPEKEVFTV